MSQTDDAPGGDIATVATPSGVLLQIPAELVTAQLYTVAAAVQGTLPPGATPADEAYLVASQLLRYLAGVGVERERITTRRDAEMKLVAAHYARQLVHVEAHQAQAEAILLHLAPQLAYPGKSRSITTPYGTIGTRKAPGVIRLKDKATEPNADLLAIAWCLEEWPGTKLFVRTEDERKFAESADLIREAVKAEAEMVPRGLAEVGAARLALEAAMAVDAPGVRELAAHYKATGELPDGYEVVEEVRNPFVKADGIAAREVEAVDVGLGE